MKTFRFKLQALLILRQRQERFALEEHARALLHRHLAVARLEAAERDMAAAWTEMRRQMDAGCSASALAQAQEFYRTLSHRCDAAGAALMAAERGVNLSLKTMMEARQQREIVDACQDREKLVFRREEARQEHRMLDEMGARRLAPLLAG